MATVTTKNEIKSRIKSYREKLGRTEEQLQNTRQKFESKFEEDSDKRDDLKAKNAKLIDEIKEETKLIRKATSKSAVYRITAKLYGEKDIADLESDQVATVSFYWFGSFALLIATSGTILALISYIVRDPEAFVPKKKFSLTRRINRISYLFFWRDIKYRCCNRWV